MIKVLVCDDDAALRLGVHATLTATGRFAVEDACDGVDAVEKARAGAFDVVLLDVDMPRMTGHEALRLIKEHNPATIVLILTAFATIDDAVRAVKDGAYNYLAKPIKGEDLLANVDRAVDAYRLISLASASFSMQTEKGREIVGQTAQMKRVFSIIMRLSKVDTPVLIRGPSGTGKELVARAVHSNSSAKDGKFVAINCSAIPESLFESELFGHEKGAFTGADQRKIGKFQFAEGGTLFLDEIGDLPLLMQVKLLRVLQEKVFTPVGSNREIEANVRIIAATNRALEDMIKTGTFREDLYYRLNVMPINLPSLAERRDDIDRLVGLFVQKFNRTQHRRITGVTAEALHVLKKYDWPGNIRELENIIEHAFILEESTRLQVSSLPDGILRATGTELTPAQLRARGDLTTPDAEIEPDPAPTLPEPEPTPAPPGEGGLDFNKHKEAFEREFIIKALTMFRGRINQTALHANIPKKTLLRKIEKYGLNARDYCE